MSTQTDKIRGAAQALINRWDSPQWEWDKHGGTANLIADLRNALSELEAQATQAHSPSVEQGVEAAAPRGTKSAKRPRKKLCKQWPNCACIMRGEIVNGMCGGLPT